MNSSTERSWYDVAKFQMMVDFINDTDVTKARNSNQQNRTGMIRRALDAISGKSHDRNNKIQTSLLNNAQACQQYIKELMEDLALQGRAMLEIRESLSNTQHHIANLTKDVADALAEIDKQLEQHEAQLYAHENRISELELEKKANNERQLWMIQWKSGELQALSPLARCYSVLDALYWGHFGAYFLQSNNEEAKYSLRRQLAFEIREQLLKDLNTAADDTLIPRADWLAMPDSPRQHDITQVLQYQGDWSLAAPASTRLSFMATQWPMLATEQQREQDRNTYHLIDIKRVSERMVQEMFEVRS